jgi:hypothetical protein
MSDLSLQCAPKQTFCPLHSAALTISPAAIRRLISGTGVFLSSSARHAGIHFAPITTFRLWAARMKLVPEHQQNRQY